MPSVVVHAFLDVFVCSSVCLCCECVYVVCTCVSAFSQMSAFRVSVFVSVLFVTAFDVVCVCICVLLQYLCFLCMPVFCWCSCVFCA